MPPVVLFDVMSTLVNDPIFSAGPTALGLSIETLFEALDPQIWFAFERGELDESTYFERWFRDGRAVDTDAFMAQMLGGYHWLPGIEPLLAELKEAGVVMHVLSNYPVWHTRIEAKLGLSRYLPWTFLSCQMGLRKPDPQIFKRCAQAVGRPPHECLFIDDQPRNTTAAEGVGMQSITFEGAAKLRADLRQLGLI